jgi:hypothetical protein
VGDLDELPARLTELRELIRECHGVIRDMERVTREVFERFDKITALMLGEDPKSRRMGRKSVPEMLADIAARAGYPVAATASTDSEIPAAFRRGTR